MPLIVMMNSLGMPGWGLHGRGRRVPEVLGDLERLDGQGPRQAMETPAIRGMGMVFAGARAVGNLVGGARGCAAGHPGGAIVAEFYGVAEDEFHGTVQPRANLGQGGPGFGGGVGNRGAPEMGWRGADRSLIVCYHRDHPSTH